MKFFACAPEGCSLFEVTIQVMGVIAVFVLLLFVTYLFYAFLKTLKLETENKIEPIKRKSI